MGNWIHDGDSHRGRCAQIRSSLGQIPQKDSFEANESPLKEVSAGGLTLNMKDFPIFVISMDCLAIH